MNSSAAIWATILLPMHTGVFVSANWPAQRAPKWNANTLTPCLLFNRFTSCTFYFPTPGANKQQPLEPLTCILHPPVYWRVSTRKRDKLAGSIAARCKGGTRTRGGGVANWFTLLEIEEEPTLNSSQFLVSCFHGESSERSLMTPWSTV